MSGIYFKLECPRNLSVLIRYQFVQFVFKQIQNSYHCFESNRLLFYFIFYDILQYLRGTFRYTSMLPPKVYKKSGIS
jgi:hypothetical protein